MHDDPTATGPLPRRIRTARDAALAYARRQAGAIAGVWRSITARSSDRTWLADKLPHLGAIIFTLVVSGCAGNAPQPDSRSEPNRSGLAAPRSDSQMCHIDRALLVPARAPDCGFGQSALKTLDPEQWAHLKIEFEKKCYQHAEKMIRDRLRQLQVASRCGFEQASR
jgi:hypothetical protein